MQEIDPSVAAESHQPSEQRKISWFTVAAAASIVFFLGNADYSLAFSKLQRLGIAVFSWVGTASETQTRSELGSSSPTNSELVSDGGSPCDIVRFQSREAFLARYPYPMAIEPKQREGCR